MSGQGRVIPGKAKPRGRFPHYKRAGDFVFVSGTSSRRPDNSFAGASANELGTVSLDIREQTRAVIENIADILEDAGGSLADMVDVTCFLVSMNDFAATMKSMPVSSMKTGLLARRWLSTSFLIHICLSK